MKSARPFRSAWLSVLTPLLVLAACTSVATGPGETTTSAEPEPAPAGASGEPEPIESGSGGDALPAGGGLDVLPMRLGPTEETTGGVPHIQIDAVRDLAHANELARRAYSLPGLENRESVVTLPGAQSLWLAGDVEIARPDVVVAGREFGHIHPDSSMHLWLPVERAREVAAQGWGELHPWVGRDNFWGGVVMVWAPESPEDVAVSVRLIVDAYNFVTGEDLNSSEFP